MSPRKLSLLVSASILLAAIVPTFAVNFCALWSPRHFHTRAFSRYVTSFDPQRGQTTPFGQRICTIKAWQLAGFAKYRTSHDYDVDPENWRNGGLWVLSPRVAFGWNVGLYPADATRWHF